MSKSKSYRVSITLECINCRDFLNTKEKGVSRYLTSKNKKNSPSNLELLKYCKYCKTHTFHKEIK